MADQLAAGECTTYQVAFTLHDGEGKHDTTITFRSSNGGLATVTIHTER